MLTTTSSKLLVACLMLVSVLGVSQAFSGPVLPNLDDPLPGRDQGIRVDGVQGEMFVVDTASTKGEVLWYHSCRMFSLE